MLTKEIFPLSERRDLKKISANRKTVDFQMYAKCLAALEWAEDYIKNGGLINQSTKFMELNVEHVPSELGGQSSSPCG